MLRSSRFAIAAALAVALAPTARAADVDKLIPADAEYVVHFNLKQLLGSEIIKKYALDQLKQALQGNDAQAMLKELGLDPLKDIQKITIGASGTDQNDAKALILNDARGFVKILSDPATGVVLGGSIVGRNAAELISVIALAVTAGLRVSDIDESLLVHPALAEALAEAAE